MTAPPAAVEWDNKRLLLEFGRLFSPYKGMLVLAAVCTVAVGLLEALLPALLGPLLDYNIPGVQQDTVDFPVEWLPLAFFLIVVTRGVFFFGRNYFVGWLVTSVQRDLRFRIAGNVLHWPPSRLMGASAGDVTSHIVFFTSGLARALMKTAVALLQESIKLVAYLLILLGIDWALTAIIFVSMPPVIVLMRYVNRRVKRMSREILSRSAHSVSSLNELVGLWRIIKSHGGEQRERSRLRRVFASMRQVELKRFAAKALLSPMSQILIALPFAYVVFRLTQGLAAGDLTPGNVATFLATMLLVRGPIRKIIKSINKWVEIAVSARAVFSFEAQSLEDDAGTRKIDGAHGALEFDGVSFDYGDGADKALDNVTLSVTAGESVAIVGGSGAGKSTLVSLLPRFLSPTAGAVRLDGVNLNDIELPSLRRQIALVTQSSLLFDDTVAANVAYPDSGTADPARVEAALEAANAMEFVRALPDGLKAEIGENGRNLSGGQRQRLALARAFYRDAPVIILDEATSALDSKTEKTVKQSLRRLLKGKTALIVAHRFSTIDFVDRVAVLDKGRLVAFGTTEELERTSPLFAELRAAQSLAPAESLDSGEETVSGEGEGLEPPTRGL